MSTASPALSFPQESAEYRKARNELLAAETELRRQIEAVAAARRKLPLGGQLAQDYVFDEGPADLSEQGEVRQTRLSELFDPGKGSLLVYSYMYGPAMATPCTSCTSILDGLNGTANSNYCPGTGLAQFVAAVFGREHLQPRLPRREQRRQPASVAECFCQTG